MKLENKDCKLVVVRNVEWDEWVVKVWDKFGRREGADVHEDSKESAVQTAKHMLTTSHIWATSRPSALDNFE
jgi:hypothetical protein